jgi:hypothetical protein
MFFDNKVESHSLVIGASGKGKSVFSEQDGIWCGQDRSAKLAR